MQGDSGEELAGHKRAWIKGTLGNLPFILGTIMVIVLAGAVLFGGQFAPHSPYETQGLTVVEGEMKVPPFEPGETYPWGTDLLGRDMMSLILAGAWQTLRLAAAVVVARMVVGFLLGAVAGWMNGRWLDRALLALSEMISAFPALLLAMTLILALGIRKGFVPFIVALCFVGWGEVMQYVRGEVMAMKPKTFIESAIATGARTPRIILKHVLPNLVPALVSITALEMGAALMLLGELGFVGIFIGGGAWAELDVFGAPYHYSDVPEWGALLSNVRDYARSYPWTAMAPAIAFFFAIMGFNLFGEGVRRLVEDVGVHISRVVNRYTLAMAAAALVFVGWVKGSTGELSVYSAQAQMFRGGRAMQDVAALTLPQVEGRALGTVGMEVSAQWIAQQFEGLGLQPAGEELTYFQTRPRSYEALDAVPSLAIGDGGPGLVYHQDYAEYAGQNRNLGQALGPVRFVAMGPLTRTMYLAHYVALEEVDFSGEILMVLSAREAEQLQEVPRAGVLVVAEDPTTLRRGRTLSSGDPISQSWGTGRQMGQDAPMLWISEATANRMLRGTGHQVEDLRLMAEGMVRDEIVTIPTEVQVAMDVRGSVYEKVPVHNVIGHLPGAAGIIGHQLDDRLIVVLAQYDSPPPLPNGVTLPGANDNASGVAVMLEAIRTMNNSGYQPYKTFLFVAYSGEGLEGGNPIRPSDVSQFLKAKRGFATSFDVEAVVELRGLGAGWGEGLELAAGGSMRLSDLFEDAAERMGVEVTRAGEEVDLSVVFDSGNPYDSGEEAPRIGLRWQGWQSLSRTPVDSPERVSETKLEKSGRALSLALMILGRETRY